MDQPGQRREAEGFADADGAVGSPGEAHVAVDGDGLVVFDVLQVLGQNEDALGAVAAEGQLFVHGVIDAAPVGFGLIEAILIALRYPRG